MDAPEWKAFGNRRLRRMSNLPFWNYDGITSKDSFIAPLFIPDMSAVRDRQCIGPIAWSCIFLIMLLVFGESLNTSDPLPKVNRPIDTVEQITWVTRFNRVESVGQCRHECVGICTGRGWTCLFDQLTTGVRQLKPVVKKSTSKSSSKWQTNCRERVGMQ